MPSGTSQSRGRFATDCDEGTERRWSARHPPGPDEEASPITYGVPSISVYS